MVWFSGWVFVVWLCASVDLGFGWGWLAFGWEVPGSGRSFWGLVGVWLGSGWALVDLLGVLSQIPFFRLILWNLRHDR
ncbi:hypothetical protein CFREI_09695 [Corynebacterium freiburgense]|nr:hypothetical protein CFREI_09695 [Corynebacterium freiburgense]